MLVSHILQITPEWCTYFLNLLKKPSRLGCVKVSLWCGANRRSTLWACSGPSWVLMLWKRCFVVIMTSRLTRTCFPASRPARTNGGHDDHSASRLRDWV